MTDKLRRVDLIIARYFYGHRLNHTPHMIMLGVDAIKDNQRELISKSRK